MISRFWPILSTILVLVFPAVGQPFDLPAPNVPDDVQGISPALTIRFGTNKWADYNGDGRPDFLLLGRLPTTGVATLPLFGDVFRSSITIGPTGTVHSYFIVRTITPLWLSDGAWGDYDRDGDLDLVTMGATTVEPPLQPTLVFYRTSGNAISPDPGILLPGLHSGSLAWGDYDNDGDLDLAASGVDGSDVHRSSVYRNEGGLRFSPANTGIMDLAYGSVSWVDYDGDDDLDLLVTGAEQEGRLRSILYRNDGGVFVDDGQQIEGLAFSRVAWGDYDSDGDPDLLMTGMRHTAVYGSGATLLYRNEAGTFVRVDHALPGAYYGAVQWLDFDADGDLDVILSGRTQTFGSNVTRACSQDVNTEFTCAQMQVQGLGAVPVPGTVYGTLGWADYDDDGDLDFLITGDTGSESVTTFYRNATSARNLPPLVPDGLSSEMVGTTVLLSWNPAIDPNTPSNGLTYDLRVGTSPGGTDVVSPHAHVATGRRRVLAPGNTGWGAGWRLESLPPGTYYWSVQAVDNQYVGSGFSQESTFTVGG